MDALCRLDSGSIGFFLPDQFFMRKYTSSLFGSFISLVLVILMPVATSNAHHSFAPYDIRNAVEIAGVAEDFNYRRPHPKLTLQDEEGVSWEIEVPIRRWERAGLAPDLIEPGDKLVVRAFPARNGKPKAAMSGFKKDGTYYSVTEQVRQKSGNEAADAIERGEPLEDVLEKYAEPE
ncbi:MAG: DUF6152 family protein [Woeseiaceae bacterium]